VIRIIALAHPTGQQSFLPEEEMGFAKTNLDPRSRRFIAIGGACFIIAIALRIFVHPVALPERILLHIVVGILLGFFIGLELFAAQGIYACKANRN
jgi:hypothetical protein